MKISYVVFRKYRFYGIFFAVGGCLAGQVFAMDPAGDQFSGSNAILENQGLSPMPPQAVAIPSSSASAVRQNRPPVAAKPPKPIPGAPKASFPVFTPSPLRKMSTASSSQPAVPETEIDRVRRLMDQRKANKEGQPSSLSVSSSLEPQPGRLAPPPPVHREEAEEGSGSSSIAQGPSPEDSPVRLRPQGLRRKIINLTGNIPTKEQEEAIRSLLEQGAGKVMAHAIREGWRNKLISLGIKNPTRQQVEDIMSQAEKLVGNPQAQAAYVRQMQELSASSSQGASSAPRDLEEARFTESSVLGPEVVVAKVQKISPSKSFNIEERGLNSPPENQNSQNTLVSREELSFATTEGNPAKPMRPALPPKPKNIQILPLKASEVRTLPARPLGDSLESKNQQAPSPFPSLRKATVRSLPRDPEPESPLQKELRKRAERLEKKATQVDLASTEVAGLTQAQIAASERFRNVSSAPGDKEEKLEEEEAFSAEGEDGSPLLAKSRLGTSGHPHTAAPYGATLKVKHGKEVKK